MRILSIRNKKIATQLKGMRKTFPLLKQHINSDQQWVWFHVSSLGEFEQGRPLIEELRRRRPDLKILLSFFSPSGYEVKKDYEGADLVCYLPLDTWINATRFVRIVKPTAAIFVKYDLWPNYLMALYKKHVPTYLASSIFRSTQFYFKNYGRYYRRVLRKITHIFVQNVYSEILLDKFNIKQVTVTGDTRFDRVQAVRKAAKDLPLLARFSNDGDEQFTIIAGSSWPVDEAFILPYVKANPAVKLIIAPHTFDEERLQTIENTLGKEITLRYTQFEEQYTHQKRCLILDCFGLLSSCYRYGSVAYIGGGFGAGIHNLPEAAVYGIPVLFGPKNEKFREARELILMGGGKQLDSPYEFGTTIDALRNDADAHKEMGMLAGAYVRTQSGATPKIMDHILNDLNNKD